MSTLTEWVNPLVVKELRQGVRSRVLWGAFALLLTVCLIISSTAVLAWWGGVEALDGGVYFGLFYGCVCVVYLFVIPSSAYQSLLKEQEGETWAVLTLTGMGAGRILRGKIASSLLTAFLYGCVVLPFLLFAYFLNGISLVSIVLFLGMLTVLMVFTTFIAVCWASFGQSRLARGLLRTALILFGLTLCSTLFGMWVGWMREAPGFTHELIVTGVWLLWAMLSFSYLFYEMAVSRMSLDSEDFSRGPRRALLIQVMGVWALTVAFWHDSKVAPLLLLTSYLSVAGILLSTDRDGVPRRLLARSRWSLLLPGAVRGYRLTLLLMLGSAGVGLAKMRTAVTPDRRELFLVAGCVAYALGYLVVALLLGRVIKAGHPSHHLRSRVAYAVLFMLGTWPPVLAALIDSRSEPWIALLSPFGGLSHLYEGDFKADTRLVMGLVLVMGVLLTLIGDRVLAQEDSRSRAA